MNRKILGVCIVFMLVAMMATPLVSAKPEVWSVTFNLETLPDLSPDADWSKFKMIETEKGLLIVDQIPASGTAQLVHGSTTMTGVVTQMVLCSKLYVGTSMRVMGNEKWTLTFDEGTLEVSATFWTEFLNLDPIVSGTCVGTHGTGIFEDAKFKGTFSTIMLPYPNEAILKIQFGSGEIKFT
jgi:hypothetical protein